MDERSVTRPTAMSWAEVVRLRTLPAALAPVILGAGSAAAVGSLSLPRTLLAAGVALALQIGSNIANDYSDGIRGTDDHRVGPPRLTASGQVSPAVVKLMAMASFAVAGVLGLILVILSQQWWLLGVGAAAVAAAWFYTGGSKPYGYLGLGEIFVFVFFGLVATCGTTYTQAGFVPWWTWVASAGIGLIACSLLMVNNLRDIDTDPAHGKMTLAVRLGEVRARSAFRLLLGVPMLLGVIALVGAAAYYGRASVVHSGVVSGVAGKAARLADGVGGSSPAALFLVAAVAFVFLGISVVYARRAALPIKAGARGRALIPALRDAGLYELIYGVALSVGVIVVGFV